MGVELMRPRFYHIMQTEEKLLRVFFIDQSDPVTLRRKAFLAPNLDHYLDLIRSGSSSEMEDIVLHTSFNWEHIAPN